MKKLLLLCLLFLGYITNSIYSQTITWTETRPLGVDTNKSWVTTSMSSDGTKIIAGAYEGRLYISTNGGSSWSETQPAGDNNKDWYTTSMSSDGTKIIAGVDDGRLYISTNSGSSWTETQPAGDEDKYWLTTSMSSDGTKIIAGNISSFIGGRLYISTNGGSSWTETQPAGDEDKSWYTTSMSSDGTKIIAGVYWSRLYISTNGGSSWTETQPAGDADRSWQTTSMSSDGTKIIAGVYLWGRLYISTNGGTNWTETRPAEDENKYWITTSMSSDGTKLIAGADGGRLYVSTDGGTSWTETQPAGNEDMSWRTTSMTPDGTKIIAGVNGGRLYLNNEPLPVELTSFSAKWNDGKVVLSWQTATEVNNYGFNVELKIENGEWRKIGFVQGHGNSNSPKDYSFVDVNPPSGKVEYRLKQIDNDGSFEFSDVVEVNMDLPTKFALEQNYPNPFNPTTTIKYSIPMIGNGLAQTVLKVYDALGREVATLVNEQKPAGNYEVKFDATGLSSGIYFYQITSGDFSAIKKMCLMK